MYHAQCKVLRKADKLFFAVQDYRQGDVNVLERIEFASRSMNDMSGEAQFIIGMLYDVLDCGSSRAE